MPSEEHLKFELPRKLEKLLASLATYYAQNGKPILQRLVVNSRYHVDEEYEYDNWDGGQWGHAIHFHVPSEIYFMLFNDLYKVSENLQNDINHIANCPHEHVAKVYLEVQDDPSLQNWREKSGVLMQPSPMAIIGSDEDLKKIWEPSCMRVFLSHKAEYKKEASLLKNACLFYGLSCFVAHEDIEPTKEWQDEIEKALASMDVMIPLLTAHFSDSKWTDQEIGVAIGRSIFIVPVKLGADPYGFIGKYQAVSGKNKEPDQLAMELFELFLSKPETREIAQSALINRFENSDSYEQSNKLITYLERIDTMEPEVINRLEVAFKANPQVRDAYRAQNRLPHLIKKLRGLQ